MIVPPQKSPTIWKMEKVVLFFITNDNKLLSFSWYILNFVLLKRVNFLTSFFIFPLTIDFTVRFVERRACRQKRQKRQNVNVVVDKSVTFILIQLYSLIKCSANVALTFFPFNKNSRFKPAISVYQQFSKIGLTVSNLDLTE